MIRQKKKKKKKKKKKIAAARGRGLFSLYIYIENFKNLVRNHWIDFNITWQECSFADPLPSLIKLFWFFKNMAAGGGAYFPYICI